MVTIGIRMWDMSYVNNAASATANFDLRIFAYISFRRSWIITRRDKEPLRNSAHNFTTASYIDHSEGTNPLSEVGPAV